MVEKAEKKEEKKKFDVFELRKELLAVAEKEAKRRPDISKVDLKKKLNEYVTGARIAENMPENMKSMIEKVISISADAAVGTIELWLRAKKEFAKQAEEKPEKAEKPAAKKTAAMRMGTKKQTARKKPARKK